MLETSFVVASSGNVQKFLGATADSVCGLSKGMDWQNPALCSLEDVALLAGTAGVAMAAST